MGGLQDKLYEVRVDISKFYATIYTHSITWGFLGKDKAKDYFRKRSSIDDLIQAGDKDAKVYKLADKLDLAVRNCQERQSIGIPIGPDTSHIIAEVVACRLDNILSEEFSDLDFSAQRYYDDYFIFVSTLDEAERILKGLQRILNQFQLEINEGKVRISKFPFPTEESFVAELFRFDFKSTNFSNSLKHYFSLLWSLMQSHPTKTDWIAVYALRRFEVGVSIIPQGSWSLFEDLIFKTAYLEPAILQVVARVLASYEARINDKTKAKLAILINKIIIEHSEVNHSFEVAWALWISKRFRIEIMKRSAEKVINMKENISALILLDISRNTNLIRGRPSFESLSLLLKDDVLSSEHWLLAYESIKKGWLVPKKKKLIENHEFFNILKKKNVEFYDESIKLLSLPLHASGAAHSTDSTTIFHSSVTALADTAFLELLENPPSLL